MTKQNIFKTFGLLTLSAFAVGILFLSVRANQVEAKDFVNSRYQMMGYMNNSDYSYPNHTKLTSEEKQKMIDLMKKHHGDNWQNHHQQMHGSDNGIQEKGGSL
ncbi:hypothetical protein HY384_02115 [Candidatus Daviesbacteria bacterium]|nr:hypothetical protein [Candidatus Daviesbacteria bacterium]